MATSSLESTTLVGPAASVAEAGHGAPTGRLRCNGETASIRPLHGFALNTLTLNSLLHEAVRPVRRP
jgi:hypothetical protein